MTKILYIGNQLTRHGNTPTGIDILGPLLQEEGYRVWYASHKKNKLVRIVDMIWKTIRHATKVDAVLIDTYSTQNFWFAFIISQLCRILNCSYIPILHGGKLPNRLQQNPKLCDMIFKNATLNVAPSGYLLDIFIQNGYPKTIYIPNPLTDTIGPTPRIFDYPRLLWVRSFSRIYNPILAVKVLETIIEYYPNAYLTMVGPAKDDSYDEVTAYCLKKNLPVTFTGKMLKSEWQLLAQQHNVMVSTSFIDNTPFSFLEAMSIGLPIVATNVGGIPYLIQHQQNGLLVDPDDVSGMSTQIISLFQEHHFPQTIIRNALQKVSQFEWENVKISWSKVFDNKL